MCPWFKGLFTSHKLISFNYEMLQLVEMQVNISLKSELMKQLPPQYVYVIF